MLSLCKMLLLQWFATLPPIVSVRLNLRPQATHGADFPSRPLIEPTDITRVALGQYDYKFKYFGTLCTDVAKQVYPDSSGTGRSHRFTIQRLSSPHEGPSVVTGSAASALSAGGDAAADSEVIADLRAEVALLRAEAAHLRAKVSLRGALPAANAAFK